MSYCPTCGQPTSPNAAFCHHCGADLKKTLGGVAEPRPRQPSRPARSSAPGRDQPRAHEAGVAAHRALQAKRADQRLKGMYVLIGGVVVALAGGLVHQFLNQEAGLAVIGVGIVTALVGYWVMPAERLSQAEYEALPGAVTENGHRCIFCGGRGIYRHTPYKTDTTLADCSRCKGELWAE